MTVSYPRRRNDRVPRRLAHGDRRGRIPTGNRRALECCDSDRPAGHRRHGRAPRPWACCSRSWPSSRAARDRPPPRPPPRRRPRSRWPPRCRRRRGRRPGRAALGVRGGRAADLGRRHPSGRRRPRRHARPVGHPLGEQRAGLRHRVPRAGRRASTSAARPAPRSTRPSAPWRPTRTLEMNSIRPTDGQTVGVAMPISITFSRVGHRPRRRRAPGRGDALGAHRGLVPLDVRRAAQLAPPGLLAPGHAGDRRGAPARGRHRRGRLRRGRPDLPLHRRPRPARPRRRQPAHARAVPGRPGAAQPARLLRPRHLPDPVRRPRRVREARDQADDLGQLGRAAARDRGVLRRGPAARRAHLEQRRVRARQRGHRAPAGPQQRLARLRQPVPGQRRASSTTGSRWATRWRSSARAAR